MACLRGGAPSMATTIPVLNAAMNSQLGRMAHVMFGGLTHAAAVRLADKLVVTDAGTLADGVFLRLGFGVRGSGHEDGDPVLAGP